MKECFICNNLIKEVDEKNITIPQRLICVKISKIINTNNICFKCKSKCNYFIISHVWNFYDNNYCNDIKKENNEQIIDKYMLSYKYKNILKTVKILEGEWMWLDTICINQNNIKEKEIEISKMEIYYKRSILCIVYLEDINLSIYKSIFELSRSQINFHIGKLKGGYLLSKNIKDICESEKESFKIVETFYKFLCGICNSKWMTRIWTLQEILLSNNNIIVDSNSKYLYIYKQNIYMFYFVVNLFESLYKIKTNIHIKTLINIFTENVELLPTNVILKMTEGRYSSVNQDYLYALFGVLKINDVKISYDKSNDLIFIEFIDSLLKKGDYSVLVNLYLENNDINKLYKSFYIGIEDDIIVENSFNNIINIKTKFFYNKKYLLSENLIDIKDTIKKLNIDSVNDFYKLLIHLGKGDIKMYKILVDSIETEQPDDSIRKICIILQNEWLYHKYNPIGWSKWEEYNGVWGRFFGEHCSNKMGNIINISKYDINITINKVIFENNYEKYIFCIWNYNPEDKQVYVIDIGIRNKRYGVIMLLVIKNNEDIFYKIGITIYCNIYNKLNLKELDYSIIKNIFPFDQEKIEF